MLYCGAASEDDSRINSLLNGSGESIDSKMNKMEITATTM